MSRCCKFSSTSWRTAATASPDFISTSGESARTRARAMARSMSLTTVSSRALGFFWHSAKAMLVRALTSPTGEMSKVVGS